jgi:hypothetical protein
MMGRMSAEASWSRWMAWMLGALLTASCATVPSSEPGSHEPQRRRRRAFMLGPNLSLSSPSERAQPPASAGEPAFPSAQALPPGWPHLSSSQEVLAPFLACASPAEFLALQERVDMARLVEGLDDWSAVRLGALGPVRAEASAALTRKRAAFLLFAVEKYGPAFAEVFALYILHSAFDDELHALLVLLSRDKQLGQTLGLMPSARAELERRGLKLSAYADRAEQPGDVLRGLGRAGRDVLSSTYLSEGARYQNMSAKRAHLPPPYQQALDEVERALVAQHYSPGNMVRGSFDYLTFGVPLGFYHLVAGTGHGVHSLAQGHYEQATRELAPAALLVAVYAGGKGARHLSEARAAVGAGVERARLRLAELRLQSLKEVAERLRERLGGEGVAELARHLQAQREAAVFVGLGGEPAAVALFEARGNVAKAQAWLSEAKAQRAGPTAGKAGPSLGGMASLVDEAAGLNLEAVQARLLRAELEAPGPRLPRDVALLERQQPSAAAPPPGVSEGHARWSEYVAYRQRRLQELKQGHAVEGPLRWEAYEQMRAWFARGLAFERVMVSLLRADAALPRAQRRWLKDFNEPRIETNVGVAKPGALGVRYVDMLVIEQRPPSGQPPRVETFSFKSRNLEQMKGKALEAQMVKDASEALTYYGETLSIRRSTLKLRDTEVKIHRVHLIYEGGELKPKDPNRLGTAIEEAQSAVVGVEVQVQ